jgi:hypothetical protein
MSAAWTTSRGARVHPAAGEDVRERRRHLGAAGVLAADEEDLGDVLRDGTLRLSDRAEPLAREPSGDRRDVVADVRAAQHRERLAHALLDRRAVERPLELAGDVLDLAGQAQLGQCVAIDRHARLPVASPGRLLRTRAAKARGPPRGGIVSLT